MTSTASARGAQRAACLLYMSLFAAAAAAQAPQDGEAAPYADPGSLAFEEERWEDVIVEYRAILEASPEDRLSLLRIAQAERELGRNEEALATLEQARTVNAPEGMLELERARNLLALGRADDALGALTIADHAGLRALDLLENGDEFDAVRGDRRFQEVHRNVRARVYPCETIPAAREFDFWIGRWEVRQPNGTLLGYDTITKRDGGCTIHEQWEGTSGSSGTSMLFYQPSREQWRQVWVGSGGTLVDVTGGSVEDGMHLEGTIEYADQGRVVAFRGTWTVAPDGRVRQRMEEFNLGSESWTLWFDGFFRRVN